jgi:hypothetical protein
VDRSQGLPADAYNADSHGPAYQSSFLDVLAEGT